MSEKRTNGDSFPCIVRAQCLKAIRDYRSYRKIHPEAFQVWACSERKGAMLLARRISRILRRPNASVSIPGGDPGYATGACSALALAEQFHATYERLAPESGYETRPETRVFDPASANGKLMIAVCDSIIRQNAAITGGGGGGGSRPMHGLVGHSESKKGA